MFCEEKCCEQTPVKDNCRLLRKRSVDEVRYGRLWAEVALPKLLEGGGATGESPYPEISSLASSKFEHQNCLFLKKVDTQP